MSLSRNSSLVVKLVLVSVAMFAFGVFAMPPLYNTFCEITGIGEKGVRIEKAAVPTAPSSTRTVKVRFDATTNSALDWSFEPEANEMQVQLGKASTALYTATNLDDHTITGRAVFNVSPPEASRYFVKTQCFCFNNQILQSKETREMPVVFFIEPDLPEDIDEVTLAYTFFKISDDPGAAPAAP